MVTKRKDGEDIFKGTEKRIVFAVNTEGFNDAGFAGKVSSMGWPELRNMGPCELGTVVSKTIDDVEFYGLVCHSLKEGWKDQKEIIKKCFDSIPGDEEVASIKIGTGLVGMLSGADWEQILEGMEESEKKIVLY